MKIEIKSHYWPVTPEFREIKLFIDGKEYYSSFMNQREIWDLVMTLRDTSEELLKIANDMDY